MTRVLGTYDQMVNVTYRMVTEDTYALSTRTD